jgi:hypothetical protein
LAAGDFAGDQREDLAIGVPGEDVGAIADAGAVNVIYGKSAASGLIAAGNQLWHQDSPGIEDVAEAGDKFGYALAAGNFNGDARDDLAIGVPGEDLRAVADAGATNVIYGQSFWFGLTAAGDDFLHQNGAEIETGDLFGAALAAGDFDGDGKDDLAVGVPREDIGAIIDAGAVDVFYGAFSGASQQWHQNSPGILDVAEVGDNFGLSVA